MDRSIYDVVWNAMLAESDWLRLVCSWMWNGDIEDRGGRWVCMHVDACLIFRHIETAFGRSKRKAIANGFGCTDDGWLRKYTTVGLLVDVSHWSDDQLVDIFNGLWWSWCFELGSILWETYKQTNSWQLILIQGNLRRLILSGQCRQDVEV